MDTLTFIIELIRALAWPITVLIILLIIRRPVLTLIPTLKRFRFQDLELDFNREVQALAQQVQTQIPETRQVTEVQHTLREELADLAKVSPRAAVLEAWVRLEQTAVETVKRHGHALSAQEARSPIQLGQTLETTGLLDDATSVIYQRLRILRNAAAHASTFVIEPQAAVEYVDSAIRLIDFLEHA